MNKFQMSATRVLPGPERFDRQAGGARSDPLSSGCVAATATRQRKRSPSDWASTSRSSDSGHHRLDEFPRSVHGVVVVATCQSGLPLKEVPRHGPQWPQHRPAHKDHVSRM